MQTTTTDSAQYNDMLSADLLPHAINELVLDQLCETKPLPRKKGHKTITFFRRMTADAGTVHEMQEGVPITDVETMTFASVNITLSQWGQVYKFSDILEMTELIDHEQQIKELCAENAALHYDTRIRNVSVAPTTGLTEQYPVGYTAANRTFSYLAATGTQANGKLTVADLLAGMVRLRVNKTRPLQGGFFVAAIPAHSTGDLMADSTYVNVKSYGDSGKGDLYRGELGNLFGVKILYQTNPFLESATQGVYSDAESAGGGRIFSTLMAGKGALGVVPLQGDRPLSPRVTVVTGPEKVDPNNQYSLVAWKIYFGQSVLNSAFGWVLRHKQNQI